MSHTVQSATNIIQKRKNGEFLQPIKLSLFYIDLEPRPNNKEIIDIRYLAYQRITVKSPKPRSDIPQCKQCQLYGHTKITAPYRLSMLSAEAHI